MNTQDSSKFRWSYLDRIEFASTRITSRGYEQYPITGVGDTFTMAINFGARGGGLQVEKGRTVTKGSPDKECGQDLPSARPV